MNGKEEGELFWMTRGDLSIKYHGLHCCCHPHFNGHGICPNCNANLAYHWTDPKLLAPCSWTVSLDAPGLKSPLFETVAVLQLIILSRSYLPDRRHGFSRSLLYTYPDLPFIYQYSFDD